MKSWFDVICCRSSKSILGSHNENTYRLLLEFLIEESSNSNERIVNFLITRIINIQKQSEPVPDDFPKNFSFLEYAILNLDLLFADVDFKEHYIKNGREEGRLFSIK